MLKSKDAMLKSEAAMLKSKAAMLEARKELAYAEWKAATPENEAKAKDRAFSFEFEFYLVFFVPNFSPLFAVYLAAKSDYESAKADLNGELIPIVFSFPVPRPC